MKRQKRRYRKELQQAKTIIQKLMYGDQLVCEFCTYFLMLSFQCLRELERITGFETQDGVKSFFGYP